MAVRLLPRFDGLPRAYWILWAGTFVNRLGGFVVPFLSLYLTEARRVSLPRVGLLVSLFGLGQLGAGPVGGWLADRVGRRRTMLLALGLGAAAMLQLGFAGSTLHLAFACFASGLCGDLYRPASGAAVADLVPPEDRIRAYGLLYWIVNLAFAISATVAGFVARAGYEWLFLGDALTTLLFAVIVALWLPETRPASAPPEVGAPKAVADGLPPWRNAPFLVFLVLVLLVGVQYQQGLVALPVDMRAHHVPPSRYGALIALNGVLIVCVQPLLLPRLQAGRAGRTLALGALLSGCGFGANALAGHFAGAAALAYGAAVVVWTLGEIASTAVSPTVVAGFAPPELRGRYQGAFQMSWGAAALAGPSAGTFVLARGGAGVLWGGCFALGLCAAAGMLLIGPRLPGGRVGRGR